MDRYDDALADRNYREAFQQYGQDLETANLDKAAEQLKSAVIKDQLLAGLDDWILARWRGRLPGLEKLLAVTRRIDADPWRDRFREVFLRRERSALVKLSQEKAAAVQPPGAILLLGVALAEVGEVQRGVDLLRKAQQRYPDDFWITTWLAYWLTEVKPAHLEESIGYYRAAVALRPRDPGVRLDMGRTFYFMGKMPAAEAEYREAVRIKPDYSMARYNLGMALYAQGKLDEAAEEYRMAIRLRPDVPQIRNNLAVAYLDQNKPDQAVVELRQALRLDPKFAEAHHTLAEALEELGKPAEAIEEFRQAKSHAPTHPLMRYNLGEALLRQGDTVGAEAELREAIRLKADYAEAYCQLGKALQQRGDFKGGLAALKRGHQLGTTHTSWREPSAQWIREAERLVALEGKLPAVRRGEYQPKDNGERLVLIKGCQLRKWHLAAARLAADAFAADPKLVDDLRAGHRYNAACEAALAAAGQGEDARDTNDAGRTRWRLQAIAWLQADLASYARLLAHGNPANRAFLTEQLRHWQRDTDLNGIRDAAALGKLPPEERKACQILWGQVEEHLTKAR
jgi:serine/threonine-protein kinase